MAPSFPIPVLSVAPDAVRDLDGHEALYGLWTLFTKCKESLQDGRRLENISWRLWYRELMLTDRPTPNNSTLHSLEKELLDEKKTLSYSTMSSSSSTISFSSSSSSSYSRSYSPALSATSLVYRPPTPAESVNVHDELPHSAHDPQALNSGTASSTSLQRLNLIDLHASSSSHSLVYNPSTTDVHVSSTLPSPLPSPSLPQSIPQPLPLSTAPTIPHVRISGVTKLSLSDNSSCQPHLSSPAISHTRSQPAASAIASFSSPSKSHPTPYPHGSSHSRPAVARSHTESSITGELDVNRIRRSSFAGMSVGRIICDMLPHAGVERDAEVEKKDLERMCRGDSGCVEAKEMERERMEVMKGHPGMQMTPLPPTGTGSATTYGSTMMTAEVSCLPTPETEEIESRSAVPAPAPREERSGRREAGEDDARGFGEVREVLGAGVRYDGGDANAFEDGVGAASRAFAAHVAHVAGAAANEVASALAPPVRTRDGAAGPSGPAYPSLRLELEGAGGADRGDDADRRDDKDRAGGWEWDKDRTGSGAALAPRSEQRATEKVKGEKDAASKAESGYPESGERVAPAGAEEERDSYSETSTPTHTHAQLLQTPPQIHHPFQPEAPEPPRLVVVNPTPNLTPHPTPPSTPIVLGGLPRVFGTAPGQWLMPPGPHIPSSSRTTGGQAQQIMQQYHLQQAQLAQLLPPLTLPPPPQRAAMTHVLDGVGYGIGAGYVHVSAAGYANGAGSLHAAGHASFSATGDRTGKSAAFAGTAGTAAVAGPSTQAQVASGVAGMAYPLATAQSSHAARGQRHEDAHRSLSPPYIQHQQQIQPHSPHSHSQHQHDRQDVLASSQTQHGLYSQVPAGGYSHAIAAHGRAAVADAEGLVPAQANLLRFGGSVSGSGADDVEGVHLLGLLPPLPAPSANTHSYANASGREHTAMSRTPTPNPNAPAPANTTSGIGNVNGSRDNVNRRSISSASSQATTASLQSTRSHATDSSSATSASARSKATAGKGFDAVLGDDRSDATFGGLSGEAQVNLGMDMDGEEGQTVDVMDDNDVALEEEEDDPLSPLPTVTHFDTSISPRTNEKTTTSRSRKRHSAPPRSTSDSSQMRIALSLSPVSPVPLGDVDVEPAVADLPSGQRDKGGVSATQPALRAAVRSRSTSSTRSAGKRSLFSAAASKASRKGNMGPPPPPATAISNAASSTTIVAAATKGAVTTKATSSTTMNRASSTRSTSRTRSTAGSSLGSRSRSREAGLGLAGLALGMTTAQAVAATVAAAVPSTRSTKPAARGRAKFSLGRAGNKKSAAVQAIRRNSSGIINKAKAKQKEEDEEEEEEAEEEEAEEEKEKEAEREEEEEVEPEEEHFGRDLRRHEDDLDEMDVEVAQAQAETLRVEREARERERLHLQEQARRAAAAEAEKERRREAERRQRQLETIAALTSTATGDNVSETSGKRPVRFNIGSNSDDGMGGRSGGSGSEVSGGVSGQSVGPDPRMGGARRKGKDKELSLEQRLAAQQQEYQRQQQQYQQYQQPHYMPLHRQLSKPQLHQLQIMEQIHQQQQRPITAQQQARQHQQQFQDQKLASQQPQHQSKQFNEQVVAVVENNATSKKGKQRETAVPLPAEPSAKPKKSNSKAQVAPADGGVVDAMLAAKIQDSLNTPLLPTGKKRVELVSTESEFETTDDEGEWSSAEMTADDAEVRQAKEEEEEQKRILLLQIQQQHDRQMQLLQQQQREQRHHQAARPQAPQRTHSSHYPAANNARGQLSRAQQRQIRAQAQAQQAVDKALLEAQRQRELFVKLPTSSFQDLAKARTNSVGLLTQLMNPDIEKFPPNHPYRRGYSSGELRRSGISALTPMQAMTPMTPTSNSSQRSPTPAAPNAEQPSAVSMVAAPNPKESSNVAPAPSDTVPAAVSAATASARPTMTRRSTADVVPTRAAFSPPLRSAGLVLTKSSAALPTATQLQVGSVTTKLAQRTAALLEHVNSNGSSGSGGYRPRGPPKDTEMEDDSDSDDGGIQMSSVAQEKLKAIAQRRGIKPTNKFSETPSPGPSNQQSAKADENDVPPWVHSQPQALHTRSQSHGEPAQRRLPAGLQLTQANEDGVPPSLAAAPIKVDYPYNLPLPIPPSTPRTTRRNMMSTELTESLRRNVLWHRHVDKPNPAMKRTASGGGDRLGELRPLTAVPSMVQLHAKGTKPEGTSQITRHETLTDKEREEVARQRRLTRNKSWANDYHYTGW